MKSVVGTALVAGALALAPAPGHAQAAQQSFLAVGDSAPDIQLTGSTRYGTLKDPVRLSDFRGQTVVLAFYFKARTPG
ncbi:MAG TPA: redoxin domain-containing protein [Gemmatimonadota bacterium]|nr:redoxin domain-containing protein [Gemmatimonadota bacterium]